MENTCKLFEGLSESEPFDAKIQELEPEDLETWYRKEKLIVELDDIQRERRFKRRLAGTVIIAGLAIEATLLTIGKLLGIPESAGSWWAVVGPVIGYLICVLYGPKK